MFGLSLNTGESKFEQEFNSYLLAKSFYSNSVRDDVSKIIEKVRKNGELDSRERKWTNIKQL